MAKDSKIEWTGPTANFWWGCTRVHRGCDHCYAADLSNRWGKDLWDNPRREIKKAIWTDILKWQAEAEAAGEVYRVFLGSMMDIFEKDQELVDGKGNKVYQIPGRHKIYSLPLRLNNLRKVIFEEIVPACPNLIFLCLTKRPSNINKMVPTAWLTEPPANVMFGASVVDQKSCEDVARHLAKVKGRKFLSIEPLLEQVNMGPFVRWTKAKEIHGYDDYAMDVDWVIVGGESGPKARPFKAEWAENILEWCRRTKTPFFMKQMGGKKKPFAPIPDDILIREFPVYHDHAHLIG